MDKITLSELADALAKQKKSLSKKEAEAFVREVFETIRENLFVDEVVKVKGLGTFKSVRVESRESVHVNTGKRIVIDSHSKITFTPDKSLSDCVNRPFAAFETMILNDETSTEEMERIDDVPEQPAEMPDEPVPEVEVAQPEPEVVEEPQPEPEVVEEAEPEPEVVEEPQPEPEVLEEPQPEPEVVEEPQPEPEELKRNPLLWRWKSPHPCLRLRRKGEVLEGACCGFFSFCSSPEVHTGCIRRRAIRVRMRRLWQRPRLR